MAIGVLGTKICLYRNAATRYAIEQRAILRRFPSDALPFYGIEATGRRYGQKMRIGVDIRDVAGICGKKPGRGSACVCPENVA